MLKVSDQHNEFPIPFEERSHGFQWFFSFYLVFLVESAKAHKGAILLLDEPGLHLHPTLQTKLIDLFERISGDNQLLYSTHLPFLVDGNHLERVRTVHLDGPEPQKTRVSNDVRPTGDRDTLFPLQAALGYSIAQTLFLGKRSVIVEGITDYWLIKTLNACFPKVGGEAALHEDTILIPAGGTSRLMPLASIMLASSGVGERHLMVLLDSDREGNQAASRMNDVFSGESSVLMLGAALNLTEATIEDLVPRDVYADAVKEGGHEFTMNDDEQSAATNVKAMEMVFQRTGLGTFGNLREGGCHAGAHRRMGQGAHFRARTHSGEGARPCRRHQRSIQRAVVKPVPNGGETERRGRARGRLSVAPADRPAWPPRLVPTCGGRDGPTR